MTPRLLAERMEVDHCNESHVNSDYLYNWFKLSEI